MSTFKTNRENLISVIRYPQEGDPQAAVSYAFSEWEEGHMTKITAYNPFSMEVEEEYRIPLSPRLIRAALDEGGIEPADVGSVRGIELYDGYEVDPADQSEYIPDDIAEEIDDSDLSFDTANDVRKSDSEQFGR
ncbi:hypothetical protein RH831_11065 [Halodesulfurarchaeum sp. HSR-GB]|uniref:hypothetical protein n=1 Tax=Halodesulfurarchaeum sp. HSR-GB TaxID=3074077 RepID=UPI002864208D|nr:hypothetical protein [Halodesulfurarchaeum sp. HSR-GB]MDR5657716.1 hypothetical protein [Halodesulfurarchaeum sp. HSR-GB]